MKYIIILLLLTFSFNVHAEKVAPELMQCFFPEPNNPDPIIQTSQYCFNTTIECMVLNDGNFACGLRGEDR